MTKFVMHSIQAKEPRAVHTNFSQHNACVTTLHCVFCNSLDTLLLCQRTRTRNKPPATLNPYLLFPLNLIASFFCYMCLVFSVLPESIHIAFFPIGSLSQTFRLLLTLTTTPTKVCAHHAPVRHRGALDVLRCHQRRRDADSSSRSQKARSKRTDT